MIKTNKLSLSSHKKPILKNITLTIPSKKITSIIGPSGAGKTTLLQVLAGIQSADTGSLTIEEQTYTFPDTSPLFYTKKHHIVMLFQQLFLWPHLTLQENITLPMKERNGFVDERAIQKLCTRLNIFHCLNQYPNQTSLGQRQRAAFARAVLLKPRYLFLDEITSALDIEQMAVLVDMLTALRNEDISIVLITHALRFARQVSDYIIFLDDGCVGEEGGVEILNDPREKRLRRFLRYC